ncbi:hypothetical protein BVRB_021270 [Beta vulgaris subsp. vulgaris]|uniref:Uncharacterized protein n=1 Tax=Beta vulgaris subsp. vulgaris TaxID=3555 RepID=A0A0J8B3M2_BETVV|nr:hypothetical protein BVRB_021270 [Beta vulgaris subsp. vulgaris]
MSGCLIRPGLYLSVALQPRFIIDKFCSDSAFVCISMMRRKQLRFSNNQSSFVDRLLSKIGTGMQTFLSAQESALLSRIVRDSSGPMTLHLLLDFVACHRLHLINWTCFQQLFTYCLFRCGETVSACIICTLEASLLSGNANVQ